MEHYAHSYSNTHAHDLYLMLSVCVVANIKATHTSASAYATDSHHSLLIFRLCVFTLCIVVKLIASIAPGTGLETGRN